MKRSSGAKFRNNIEINGALLYIIRFFLDKYVVVFFSSKNGRNFNSLETEINGNTATARSLSKSYKKAKVANKPYFCLGLAIFFFF